MGIEIEPIWLPRESQQIDMADIGSKLMVSTDEWSIDRKTYNSATKYLGLRPTTDAMATDRNKMCDKFFSALPQLGSSGINFFAQKLSPNEIYWICPPPKVAARVFKHLLAQEDDIRAYMGVPEWKHANYWPMIIHGDSFHKNIIKVFYARPTFQSDNESDTMFRGRKSFRFLIMLVMSKTERYHRLKYE